MVQYTWVKGAVPKEILVKQVYGIAFSHEGNVILRVENGKYKLTGGRPEIDDNDFSDTLRREYLEELNVELENLYYLGYLLVEEEQKKYAQVRMIAKIKNIGDIKPDIDNGKIYRRFMAKQTNVKKYLNYQDLAGNQLIDDAINLANEKYKFKVKDMEYYI